MPWTDIPFLARIRACVNLRIASLDFPECLEDQFKGMRT
jgi:hypothetical protein